MEDRIAKVLYDHLTEIATRRTLLTRKPRLQYSKRVNWAKTVAAAVIEELDR